MLKSFLKNKKGNLCIEKLGKQIAYLKDVNMRPNLKV